MRKNYINKTPNSKIKIIFNTNDGSIIGQNYFDINTKLKNVFNFFEINFSNKGYKLKTDYKLFSKKINPNNTIYDLLISKSNSKNILNNSEIYIEVSENINIENEEIYNTILFPKLNPFELIEYNSLNNKLKYIKCPGQTINFSSLYKFSKESAFCNSEKDLFLSGGLYNGKTLNFFWIINKQNYQILKKTMPIFKKYHSMLYIPDNFVLIAGGDTLSTYIYDIENKQFIRWASMNKKHFQPGLIIIGDYAYAFSSLSDKKEENNFFEKTDLTSKNPKWEKIYPLFDIYGIKNDFYSLHFGLVQKNEDEILIMGGEQNKNRYVYNTIVNKMYLSDKNNLGISFWDKTFYNINNKYKLGIPLSFSQEHTLLLLNKQNESLIKAICSSNTKNNDNNTFDVLIDNNNEKEKEEGIIMIKNNDELNNDINNDNIFEEEIIFTEDFSKKNEDIKLNKNKEHNKKEYLFLPNYIIMEQFINRELNLSNEKENNIYNNTKEKNIENDYIIYEVYEQKKDDNEKISKRENRHNYLYIPTSLLDEQIINRQIISSNNNKDTKDIKNNNEEIICFESSQILNDEEENKNKYSSYKKPYIKKEIFYIPNSALEEQIIQREFLKFKRKKKNIELIQKNNEDIDIDNSNNINNDEILINYNNEEEKENEINKKHSQCPIRKTNILYIPMSSFDEQIVNRVVNTINNGDNEDYTKPLIKRKIYKIKIDDNKDKEILNENEIINEIYNEDNIKENSKYFIIRKNKAKIYIPQNIIEEQIINREVKEN